VIANYTGVDGMAFAVMIGMCAQVMLALSDAAVAKVCAGIMQWLLSLF
jgi:hypothetical protein